MNSRRTSGPAAPRMAARTLRAWDRRTIHRASPTEPRRQVPPDRRPRRRDRAARGCGSTPIRCRSCRSARRGTRGRPTAPTGAGLPVAKLARSRRNSSPHGKMRPSSPRAAFSHCASLGSVTRQPSAEQVPSAPRALPGTRESTPPAIGSKPRHPARRRTTRDGAAVRRAPAGRCSWPVAATKAAELGHSHLGAADEEGRHVDPALRLPRAPALDVVGEGVDARIASHQEGSVSDLHEAEPAGRLGDDRDRRGSPEAPEKRVAGLRAGAEAIPSESNAPDPARAIWFR